MTDLMNITVKDFLGIHLAQIAIPPGITLVAGSNYAGKSSLLHALAALGTKDPMLTSLAKKYADKMVHDGAKASALVLTAPKGGTEIMLPSASVVTQGEPPIMSKIAAGLQWIGDLTQAERASLFVDLLGARPDRDELTAELKVVGVRDEHIETVCDLVEQQGWDSACTTLKDNRTKYKNQWERLTNERWGKDKGPAWRPNGWRPELEEEEEEALSKKIADAKSALDAAAARKAVSIDERRRLQELVDSKPRIENEIGEINTTLNNLQDAILDVRKEIDGIGTVRDSRAIPCPHCGQPLDLRPIYGAAGATSVEIVKAEIVEETVLKKRREQWKALMDEVTGAENRIRQETTKRDDLVRHLNEADEAARRLQTMGATASEKEGNAHAQALLAYDTAVLDKRMHDMVGESATLCRRIEINTKVIDLLEPDGLRKTKMVRLLAKFQETTLDQLTAGASISTWKKVTIDPDTLMPLYGGRPYILLADSEKFRCRVSLQVAIAMLDGSDMIVIDSSDILNDLGRDDLFTILDGLPVPVVVGMMANSPDVVPVLDDPGINMGATYWVSNGGITKLGAQT